MKDRILQILACAAAVAFAVFFCYALILETQAGELEITQQLYDQAKMRRG